jgi:hypothetical protein
MTEQDIAIVQRVLEDCFRVREKPDDGIDGEPWWVGVDTCVFNDDGNIGPGQSNGFWDDVHSREAAEKCRAQCIAGIIQAIRERNELTQAATRSASPAPCATSPPGKEPPPG